MCDEKKNSDAITLGIDVKTALIERVEESIEVVRKERIALQEKIENSSLLEMQLKLDFNMACNLAQKEYLDACYKLSSEEGFKRLNADYIEAIDTLKKEFYKTQKLRKQIRLKEDKESKNEIDEPLLKRYFLDNVKCLIEVWVLKFIGFNVENEESLATKYQECIDDYLENRNQREMCEKQFTKLSIEHGEMDDALKVKLEKLNTLKNELLKPDFKDNKNLQEYLLDKDNLNHADSNGFVPLHYACMLDDPLLAKKLVNRGATNKIKNLQYIYQNKTCSTNDMLLWLRDDHRYRLYVTNKIFKEKGVDGILNMGIKPKEDVRELAPAALIC